MLTFPAMTMILLNSVLSNPSLPFSDVPDASIVSPPAVPVVAPPLEEPESTFAYRQPWTSPAAAYSSRVISCDDATPMNQVYLDDFVVGQSGRLLGLRWWGVLFNQNQVGKPYHLAIYREVDCQPGALLWEACVVPHVTLVGRDCEDHYVCEFKTPVPPFQASANTRYWLEIAEDDANSATSGTDDFLWSGRQPIKGCRAVQTPDRQQFLFFTDPCNDRPSDMSFDLLFARP